MGFASLLGLILSRLLLATLPLVDCCRLHPVGKCSLLQKVSGRPISLNLQGRRLTILAQFNSYLEIGWLPLAILEKKLRKNLCAEVEFVHAVTAGGSVKFLPVV